MSHDEHIKARPDHQAEETLILRFPKDAKHSDESSTRASIFLRLGADDVERRELGWKEFSARYAPVIRGYARRRGLSDQDAEDVLQDVLLGFFRVSPQFVYDPSKGRFRGFLMRATQNAIRQRWRKERRHVHDNTSPEQLGDDADMNIWDREWADQLLRRALETVRSRFEPKTFEAFELQALRGVNPATVAGALGMSVESAHQAKSRVSKALRETMDTLQHLED